MHKKRLPLVEAVLLVLLIVAPLFLNDFLTVIATRMLILALLAISFDLCWGYSGIMTFGQGLFFGMAGYAVALFANKLGFVQIWGVIPIGIFTGAVVSFLLAWLLLLGKKPPEIIFVALGTLPRRSWWSWLTPGKKQKVDQIMARLNLRELAHKPISQLSGGQLQRGILARGLIRDAEVLLFDEPLSAVDGMNRRLVWEALDLAVEEGATLLFVTHNSEDSSRCDICLQVDRGQVS